jgi:hypothetical protein
MKVSLFDELLSKEMTRKEFLLHIGLLLLTLTGISSLLRTISDPHLASRNTKSSKGFGSGPYGV